MADKSVGELIAAQSVTPTDLFVLEQNGTAKKLTGQILENWLVSFADGHGGIQSIVKHSTSGLKDTYRITLADTTTFDFIVTNGKAISSVEQTSEEGLTRTYTIAFNDNTSQTFTVTDGKSITNIEKTATNVLTDTYTISYNDGTTSTFTVKNGKGISSFAKVSTVGLVDTYRIEYNDGTSDEFTVTNGAKGDKGDNQYVWIKYASQKPTASSHSFGDVADNWIGIYSGASATAPTDWTQYEWFQWKGEKGDTGEPATLVSSQVTYQVGDSGTIIPSGVWSESVAVVPQGKYLWTKVVHQFNTGDPVMSYFVSRMGMDGAGSVSSVANVSPDSDGNVPLTAEDIGALPNTGGDLTGAINMNGHKIRGLNEPTADDEPTTKGYVDANKVDKENVVNNFITTAAGYVADARALKTLNDKNLTMDLLLENERETEEFDSTTLNMENADLSQYIQFIVVTRRESDLAIYGVSLCEFGDATLYAQIAAVSGGIAISCRNIKITSEDIWFDLGVFGNAGSITTGAKYCIPVRIYGIKRGI